MVELSYQAKPCQTKTEVILHVTFYHRNVQNETGNAYTKEALAHVLSDSLEIDFVMETVKIMQRDHGISLQKETMIHSDQGFHYTSVQFMKLVNDLGLRQSMSRRGNCWDNAPQESFYGHMKDELTEKMACWETFDDAKRDVDDWFDYYNNDRYQWQLAKLSPRQYYRYVTTGEYPLPGNPPKI